MHRFGVPVTDGQRHWRMIVDGKNVADAIGVAIDWCKDTPYTVTADDTVEWVGFIS